MKNFSPCNDDVKHACLALQQGGSILYPTDTVWGLGCDATSDNAVASIFAIKNRPVSQSMIVLVNNEAMLERYVEKVPEIAWQLTEVADAPLTIIYPGARNLAAAIVATDGSIGIRLCRDAFCQQLIARFGKPIVSTSANVSGEKAPAFFAEISPHIKSAVDYIVSQRQHDKTPAVPSSIIKLGHNGEFEIIRK